MSLLFNMVSRLVITFLPRSKHLLISWLQYYSQLFWSPRKEYVTAYAFSLSICHEVRGLDTMILVFECWVLSQFFYSPLLPSLIGSLVPLQFWPLKWHIWVFWYFSFAILIPACDSSSLAFHMTYSAYKVDKQSDNIQPCCTLFPILHQSIVPCQVLTSGSWHRYRFLRRQVRWSAIPIFLRIFQFVGIKIILLFSIVNKAEVDVFLKLSCFSMIQRMLTIWSVSTAFLKSTLNIWKFMVHLKPVEAWLGEFWAFLC